MQPIDCGCSPLSTRLVRGLSDAPWARMESFVDGGIILERVAYRSHRSVPISQCQP
jgi:hypothetical protein